MNLEDFRYISTIAKLGRFSAAAQELFISQPALSQRVKYIEKEYGISIFTRTPTGVTMTENGAVFVKFANEILYNEANLRKQLKNNREKTVEKLRVGTSQLLNTYIFDLLIDTFRMHYPSVKLDIIVDTSVPLQKKLLSGDLDLIVIHKAGETDDKFDHQIIFQDRMVVIPAVGSRLESHIQGLGKAIYAPLPLALLQDEPFALLSMDRFLSRKVTEKLHENNILLDIRQYSDNYDFLYKMAKRGISSTILLESYFHPENDYIPFYYLAADDLAVPVQICYRKDSPTADICERLTKLALDLKLQADFSDYA